MRVAYAVSALVVLAAPFGCASLLGDFTAGTAPVGEDGGRSDSAAPPVDSGGGDSTVPSDAGPDVAADAPGDVAVDVIEEPEAAPPLQLLTCGNLASPTPITLQSIPPFDAGGNGNGFPIGSLYVEHLPGTSHARIAANYNTAAGGETAIYTVQESGGGGSPSIVTFPGTSIQAERKTATAMLLLLRQYSTNDFALYAIADTDPGTNTPIPVATIPDPPLVGSGDFRASLLDLGASSYFTLASYATTVAGAYDLASWMSSTTQWTERPGGAQGLAVDGPLVADAVNVYQFLGPPGPGGSGGPSTVYQYTYPIYDGGGPSSRQITAGTTTAALMAAAHPTATSGYELVFVELGGSQSGNYRAGLVDPTNLDTFMVDDLSALSFKPGGDAGFFDTTPFGNNGGGTRWLSNGDFASMGTGGTGGGNYTGLNFYVGTTGGQWVIQTAGTGQNLLSGTTVLGASFDLSSAVNDLLFSFDVAWTQQLGDGTAVLYFNPLSCQL